MATKTTAKKSTKSAKATKSTKTVKKTAPKTSAKPAALVQNHAVETKKPAVTASTPAANPVKVKKSYVILIVAILLIGALLYYFRSVFVAAVVNGQPISRMEVVKETEKQSGKQALNTLVRNALIEQEAKKQNVTVNEKEIDDEIKKVEGTLAKQGQKIDQVLELQGMTKADLRRLIRLDKLVGKMVGKDIKISEKDVNDYIEKNKDMMPKDQDEATVKKSVADRLKQQALNDKVKVWLENLEKNSKTVYFVQY